jgi:hypothetical protein
VVHVEVGKEYAYIFLTYSYYSGEAFVILSASLTADDPDIQSNISWWFLTFREECK